MPSIQGNLDSACRNGRQQLVFVYGSLKWGMPNHPQMAGASFAGQARLQGLLLFDLGPFPMAIVGHSPQHSLDGELYRVSAEHLRQLDRFEGTPRLYERWRWPLADGRWAWVYLGRQRQVRYGTPIGNGIWNGPNRQRLGHEPAASGSEANRQR